MPISPENIAEAERLAKLGIATLINGKYLSRQDFENWLASALQAKDDSAKAEIQKLQNTTEGQRLTEGGTSGNGGSPTQLQDGDFPEQWFNHQYALSSSEDIADALAERIFEEYVRPIALHAKPFAEMRQWIRDAFKNARQSEERVMETAREWGDILYRQMINTKGEFCGIDLSIIRSIQQDALKAAGGVVPEGFVVTPLQSSAVMEKEGVIAFGKEGYGATLSDARLCYKAMIKSAPVVTLKSEQEVAQKAKKAAFEYIAAWIKTQRNDVPMTGEEACAAIRKLIDEDALS